MFSDMSKPTLMVAALIGGLALFIAGFIIALEVRSTDASPAAATTGSGCYTNWNADTCSAGYTAVETGVWTTLQTAAAGGTICAAEKALDLSVNQTTVALTRPGNFPNGDGHIVNLEPCAICCASGVAAVGGIGELPDVAGTGDTLPRNPIIIAAVTALVAFGAGAFYARRRWSRS